MKIQDIADWITIFAFAFAACSKIWKIIRKPVFSLLLAITDSMIALLNKVNDWLQNSS